MVVVVDSAGGVGAVTEAVVSKPGPGFPGDVVGVTSRTDTLIGPKSLLADSLGHINLYMPVNRLISPKKTSRCLSKAFFVYDSKLSPKFLFLTTRESLPALGPAGNLGDLCSMAWWKGLKADAPTGCGCVCGWWPGGGGRQCGGRDPRGNPPHPWPAPCSRPRCCNPVQSKKCRLHASEDSVYSASPLSSRRGDLHIA